ERRVRKYHMPVAAQLLPIELEARFGDANENTYRPATGLLQALARIAGILKNLPGALQEEPLLRIDTCCLAWRNVEKQRVKVSESVDETAPAGIATPCCHGPVGIRFEEILHRPAVRGNFTDAVTAGA